VLIQSQIDASSSSSVEVCDEQLAECAAFRCVVPKLLFDLKAAGTRLPNKKKGRQLWLASDELELRVEGATGAGAVETIPYVMIIEVQNTRDTEFKLAWYGEPDAAADLSNHAGAEAASVPGTAIELDDMQEELPLDSPDWQPSAAAAEKSSSRESMVGQDLRPRREIRLQYSGSGPRTTRIAGEIADRKLLAEHIAKKKTQRVAALAATSDQEQATGRAVSTAAAERKRRLARHLKDMTGLTEAERINDAVRSIIEGERAADATAFAGLHKFVKRFTELAAPEPGRLKELREMATLVQRELLENRRSQLLPLLNQLEEDASAADPSADKGVATGGAATEALVGLSLTQIVNQSIEEYMMDNLADSIWACVRACESADEAAAVEAKRSVLRRKPQGFFGIEPENFSPSAWVDAVSALDTMRHAILPTDKLRTLLRAKDAVLATFSAEHPAEARADGKKAKARTLAGDDFQPIFIYMVAQCSLPELAPTCQLLWELCDPKELVGEGGYYLTQFESAVYFISSWQMTAEEEAGAQQQPQLQAADDTGAAAAAAAVQEQAEAEEAEGGEAGLATPPRMPADSVSEDPALAAIEQEIATLLRDKRARARKQCCCCCCCRRRRRCCCCCCCRCCRCCCCCCCCCRCRCRRRRCRRLSALALLHDPLVLCL
jgi:hypothetical protein